MGGGGGDGGASDRAAEDRERKASAARDINRLFGVDSGPTGVPDRLDFYTMPASPNNVQGERPTPVFNEAAYNKAVKKYNVRNAAYSAEATQNKAARDELYNRNATNVGEFNHTKLDKDMSNSERELRFSLARSGLFGGSEDIDQHAKQNEKYQEGALQVQNMADTAKNDFMGRDENTRLDIINQINSGVDASSALNAAQRNLQLNADRASATASSNIIGNVFDDAALIYQTQQQNQGVQNARQKWQVPGAYFSAPTYSGTQRG